MAMEWEGPFMDIDPLTLSAIVQAQLEDSQELACGHKGKQREGTVTDSQVAMQMYLEDLQNCNAFLEDRKLAQSISLAVQQDGDLLHREFQREQQIARDREIAESIARGARVRDDGSTHESAGSSKAREPTIPDPWEDAELLAKAAAIYMDCSNDSPFSAPPPPPALTPDYESDEGTIAESSAWAAARKYNDTPKKGNCIACGDEKDFFEVARVPCKHEYCRPCLEDLFSLSMKDETLFPPRCDGQEIPLRSVRLFLPSQLAKEFDAKYNELSTKNRTYCHDRACETFIPAQSIENDIAACPRCRKTTCTMCKMPSHSGDCPEDEALQQLLETTEQQQWQRCPTCKAIVELNTGCNHITCRCGANFCYVCAAPWRTCGCPQWEEQRLLERATQIVDRNPNRRLFRPPRIEHDQPQARHRSRPRSVVTPVAHPTTTRREPSPASEWESDFSDHSEWQHDWWQDDDETLIPQTDQNMQGEEDSATLDAATFHIQDILPSQTPTSAETARDHRIADAIEILRENHACSHDKWRWVRGPHQCEECQHVLRQYIFECRQCHLQACNRCRRNRL
ncbi:hypothetical protein AC579_7305 [Pseudocercospora musae]|uniref:RBR-type E3 ubiquitin transferase n=1 Tax=Pseudocercospora musae TaxID=113226 RepID=A0A139I136_9PEZI|nr:hypothetical protein AC579_7305 [Pseudocercospora musae]